MALLVRFRVALAVVLTALAAAAGVFVFARPQHEPRYESEMLDFSEQKYYSPTRVRAAFAAEGVELRVFGDPSPFVHLSDRGGAVQSHHLQVIVAPRNGKGSWGPELERYDERFGNVLVTYGGRDEALLERVDAAVENLR